MLESISRLLPALPFLAQVSPQLWSVIDAGGSKAIIAVLAGVIVYQARQNAALHDAIHARDREHATNVQAVHTAHAATVQALQTSHAEALARVTEQRIEEMESVTKGIAALDSAARVIETLPRGKR